MAGMSTHKSGVFFSNVLFIPDVATLGAMCGLASFDRKDVKALLLEHREFSEVIICSFGINFYFNYDCLLQS
jgi:hypothetical protein